MLKQARWALLIAIASVAPLAAQRPFSGTPELTYAIDRLPVTGRVLMIAAHPDDENTALLAYLARGRKVRTGYLSLTRGEGGQNLLGPEQGPLLGVIRTQELLEARRIDGAEQFFTSAVDFGFTKSAEETLRVWDRRRVLGDIVFVIRRFQPHVIVLRFSGTPRDGHGQHQSSAILAKEAFAAAADPSQFPEQLQYVKPWRTTRLLWNAFAFSAEQEREAAALPDKIEIDVGQYDPVFGYSYAEIAGLSRSRHRSQAMGSPQRKGPVRERLVHVAGERAKSDLFDGIPLGIGSLPGGNAAASRLDEVRKRFEPAHPEASVPALLEAREAVRSMPPFPGQERKLSEFDDALALASGLWLEANADRHSAAPGAQVKITLSALARTAAGARVKSVSVGGLTAPSDGGAPAPQWTNTVNWTVPGDASPTQPYWLTGRAPAPELVGAAQNPPVLEASFAIEFPGGRTLEMRRPVQHRYVDRMYGELVRPFVIVPPVSVGLPLAAFVFGNAAAREVAIEVRAEAGATEGDVRLEAPQDWKVTPESRHYKLSHTGEQVSALFRVTPPANAQQGALRAVAKNGGAPVSDAVEVIDYPHIQPQTVLHRAEAKAVRADIRLLSKHIGYVAGAGDEVPGALEQIGATVTLLTADDLAHGDLSRFDAIVTGVRAYNVREDLIANQARLLEYANAGGTLVVQYNVFERTQLDLGPYPITLSRDRVSVEDAPVRVLQPDSPLLNEPNRITAEDFAGWVQERGLYFAGTWDPRYQTLIESNDPGEKPLPGGILYTRYGKGAYVFTAYSWFRQLPAGVPGAYRIFANLLSAGKTLRP